MTRRPLLALLAWVGALLTAIAVFTAMGAGTLPAPSLTEPGTWGGWAAGQHPLVAVTAVLRLLVLGMAWYLLATTTVGAAARLVRSAAGVRAADAVSLPIVRRILRASLGAGLAATVAVASAGAPTLGGGAPRLVAAAADTDAPPLDAPRMRPLPPRDAAPGTTAPTPPSSPADAPAAPTPEPDRPPATTPAPMPRPDRPPATTPAPTPQPDRAPTADALVTVAVGDHLWGIAERHLRDLDGAAPRDRPVTAYWRRLVDANRDRLVDADNPDLILPGQRFVLPAVDDREVTP